MEIQELEKRANNSGSSEEQEEAFTKTAFVIFSNPSDV